jgi:glycosyltransferase involved in cell wall biosynthesis
MFDQTSGGKYDYYHLLQLFLFPLGLGEVMTLPSVSVVIPTAGRRPSILAAVSSALEQTHVPLEVIVVFDCNENSMSSALRDLSSLVRVFFTGGVGGNGARMRGVAEAKGDIVAFLDDDDAWAPEKLQLQIAVWRGGSEAHRYTLVSCRIAVIDSSGRIQKTLPSRLLGTHERIAEYLFRCSSVLCDVGLLHSSTLMCDRALVEMEPWDVGLSRHQDWDWVLRIGSRRDVALRMCPDVLVGVTMNDSQSISISGDWRASLKWLEERADQLTARERGDFLLCFTAPIAIRHGGRGKGLVIAGRALHSGRPGVAAWLIWAHYMLFEYRALALRRWLRLGTQATWQREPTLRQ